MSGIMMSAIRASAFGANMPNLPSSSLFARTTVTPTTAVALFTLNTDGSITKGTGTSGPVQWLTNINAGDGANWWVRAVLITGSFPSTGTWVQLNVAKSFSKSQTSGGINDGFADLQFSPDGGSTIAYTATSVELYAEQTI